MMDEIGRQMTEGEREGTGSTETIILEIHFNGIYFRVNLKLWNPVKNVKYLFIKPERKTKRYQGKAGF